MQPYFGQQSPESPLKANIEWSGSRIKSEANLTLASFLKWKKHQAQYNLHLTYVCMCSSLFVGLHLMRWFVGGSPRSQTCIKAEVSQNHQGSTAKIVILEELCRRYESILHSVSSLYHTIQNLDAIDWQRKSDVYSEVSSGKSRNTRWWSKDGLDQLHLCEGDYCKWSYTGKHKRDTAK